MRHLLTLFDLSPDEIQQIFALANELKMALERGERQPYLAGRVMGLLFEKPSLRTRVSFETAMAHLGGSSQFLGQDVGWGQRESVEDFARVLSQYVDIIVCRTRDHQRVEHVPADDVPDPEGQSAHPDRRDEGDQFGQRADGSGHREPGDIARPPRRRRNSQPRAADDPSGPCRDEGESREGDPQAGERCRRLRRVIVVNRLRRPARTPHLVGPHPSQQKQAVNVDHRDQK